MGLLGNALGYSIVKYTCHTFNTDKCLLIQPALTEIKARSTCILMFLNPQLVIPDTASVYTYPANSAVRLFLNPIFRVEEQ